MSGRKKKNTENKSEKPKKAGFFLKILNLSKKKKERKRFF